MTQLSNYFFAILTDESGASGFKGLLEKYLGTSGGTAVYAILLAVINIVLIFVIIQQIFRLLHALQEKNSADEKERADAMITVKGAIITIIIVAVVGVAGINMFFAFSDSFIKVASGQSI
ncbi:MAG: hypothetical protein LBF02_02925 [Mycoplasmataceae bacterium]|jgi:uncharacterized membrane protein YjgN (DUF898 family)|nr:hypothetical protein [Mycoplasmataceae bacterium]